MVNNAVSVLISTKNLNISIKKIPSEACYNSNKTKLVSCKMVAMNAWSDIKLYDFYYFTFGELWPSSL